MPTCERTINPALPIENDPHTVVLRLNSEQTFKVVHIVKCLGLSWGDVDRIHAVFNTYDLDDDHTLSHQEFCDLHGAIVSDYSPSLRSHVS